MSQQLHISSLSCALALVCLCLVARVGVNADVLVDPAGPIVTVEQTR